MEALLVLGLLLVLLGIGLPVAWSFAGVVAALAWIYDANPNTLMLQGFRSLNSVILLALPLFILAGYLMQSGGIANRLVGFIEMAIGRRRGGLGNAMVGAAGLFGAIAGTATAAVAAIGTLMIDPMAERGYPRGYSAALLGISSLLGILIPPSITMILFAVATQQSVAACFAASIVPGIMLMIGLMIFNRAQIGRRIHEIRDEGQMTGAEKWRIALRTIPAFSLPVIIIGGIYGGFFTPTEAAAFAVLAAVLIGLFIYRDMSLARLRDSTVAAAETTGSIVLILLFSFVIGRILVAERIPQDLTELVASLVSNPIGVMILVNVFLIIAGALIDDVSVTVVIAPLLLPLMVSVEVHPVHFAAIVATSVVIGANSPPMAPVLFMACRIGRASVHQAVGPALRMMAFVALPVMVLTTFIPALSLALPRWLGLL
ncbi:TRAP transporter large permease [Paracoccus thiocyanatus]|uniref:TRAP transporter large permease protein n=1 Tax=Paracoccus thiocyanatus TaxID=34006 RepID=A0A3D8P9W1_9RHOB|nr:TRAP transporter large permease [Paracoccus thiocyanatus]RDW12866.1 C4-dicarboxylate ABC transporter permease [Paracoccus thiocyanatus]